MKRVVLLIIAIGIIGFGMWTFHGGGAKAQFETITTEYPENEHVRIRWMISHEPVRYFLRAAEVFKEVVERESNGEIAVEIISMPSSDIIGHKRHIELRDRAHEMIRNGHAEMMQPYLSELQDINAQTQALDVPFLFRDYRHIDAVVDGPIGDELLEDFSTDEISGLAFTFSGGFMNFASMEGPVGGLEEFKGKRTSYGMSDVITELKKELGMDIVVIEDENGDIESGYWEYAKPEVSDIAETNYDNIITLTDKGTIQEVLHSKHRVLFTMLAINTAFYEALTPEHQLVVAQAAKEAARAEREIIESDEATVAAHSKYASLVREMTPEDQQILRRVGATVEARVLNQDSKDLIRRIRAVR